MPLFVIHAVDKANALETRLANRPAHLEHLNGFNGLKIAGPLLDERGDPAGSLLIVEADDMAAIQAFCDRDPYVKAGLFDRVEIRPFRVSVGSL
jgi:uncharacterized protein YciI